MPFLKNSAIVAIVALATAPLMFIGFAVYGAAKLLVDRVRRSPTMASAK